MDPELREMFAKVTKGSLSGKAGEPAKEDFKINGQYVDTPEQGRRRHSVLRRLRREGGARVPRRGGASPTQPFFINVNFMKVHQPNMPAPGLRAQVAVQEQVRRLGRRARHPHRPHHGQARELGLDKNTLVFYTTDNGAWQDVYPDAGYTPFRGTKGTVREGGNRVPAIAWLARQDQRRAPRTTTSSAAST